MDMRTKACFALGLFNWVLLCSAQYEKVWSSPFDDYDQWALP
jgi:hypothetical protein